MSRVLKEVSENLSEHKPILIAHRGDTINFPENTPEAFNSAFLKGADGVEMDVQLLNREIVVEHDSPLIRGHNYPKLSEVLKQVYDKGRLEIELKVTNTEILSIIKNQLEPYPNADIELVTSEIPLLPYVRSAFPNKKLGLIMHDFLFQDWMDQKLVAEKIVGWTTMSKADITHLPFTVINKFGGYSLINDLHKSGLLIHTHIYNNPNEVKYLSDAIKFKIDQCTIDNIRLVNI